MVKSGQVVGCASVSCGCPTMSRATVGRGGLYEAHIPAKYRSTFPQARVPSSDEHPGGSCDSQIAARQGSVPSVGVIGRLHGRSVFANLREQGVRVRAGWLWCAMSIDPTADGPHVGYAIGRTYGNAVERNLLRRRLRVAFESHAHTLPSGWYLVGVSPRRPHPTWAEALKAVDRLVMTVQIKAASQ